MGKTDENLKEALAGESHAATRYMAFAEKAEEEGFSGVARLFRAAARSEMVHARNHMKALGAIGSTEENIRAAIEGETHEFQKMYPAMAKEAAAENETEARHSFEYAMSVEMVHAQLFTAALKDPSAQPDTVYHVCPLCGYTVAGDPPRKCPYCGVDASKFLEIA